MASADYQKHGLYLHNWYRKRHGSPKMVLSERLNKAADAYAYKLACRRQLAHTSGLDYNENLYMSIGDRSKTKKQHVYAACEAWYNEKKFYSYSNPGFSMQTGHFTAMVWKGSTQLGIGYGESNGYIVICACYKPHANGSFNFRANVLPYREVEDSDDEDKATSTKDEKQPGIFNKDMTAIAKRLDSFKNWPSPKSQAPSQLAESGFYYSGETDKVICFHCGIDVFNWLPHGNVWLEHEHFSKDCPHLLSHKDEKESDIFNKYMTTPEKRLKTFETWQSTKPQTPDEFTKCGFYYTGEADKTACYNCGIVIWDLDPEDNLWIEHERHSLAINSKLCPFVLSNTSILEEEKRKQEAEKVAKDEKVGDKKAKSTRSTRDGNDNLLNPEIKELFDSEADDDSTIGCLELQKILSTMFGTDFVKVQLDKTKCSLLISLMTIRTGEKARINIEEFEGVLGCLKVMSETAEKFDKDKSDTLDPFELKEALEHSGFHVGYKTFQTLKELFCEDGDSMGEAGFLLCFVLLSKLQIVREMSAASDIFSDFCLKDWMQDQIKKASAD